MIGLDTTKHCPLCEDAGRRIDALTIERNDALAAAQLLKEQNEELTRKLAEYEAAPVIGYYGTAGEDDFAFTIRKPFTRSHLDALIANAVTSRDKRIAELEATIKASQEQKPFGYFCDWGDYDGDQRIAMYYGEPGSATVDDWSVCPKVHKNVRLYTAPVIPQDVQRDADRYRHLRQDTATEFGEPWAITRYAKGDLRNIDEGTCPLFGVALDTAIDAAMRKEVVL